MSTEQHSIECRRCQKKIWLNAFNYDVKDCQKRKCWGQTHKARQEAANMKNCHEEDFLGPEVGVIKIHDQPISPQNNLRFSNNEGQVVNGQWVPWEGDGYCD